MTREVRRSEKQRSEVEFGERKVDFGDGDGKARAEGARRERGKGREMKEREERFQARCPNALLLGYIRARLDWSRWTGSSIFEAPTVMGERQAHLRKLKSCLLLSYSSLSFDISLVKSHHSNATSQETTDRGQGEPRVDEGHLGHVGAQG